MSELQKLTGFGNRTVVSNAVQGLVGKNFIRPVGTRRLGSNEPQAYELLNPITCEGLAIESADKRNYQSLRSVLRHAGLGYFNTPIDVLRQMSQKSSAALALFMAADRCVNLARQRDIEIRSAELRAMSGQDPKTFKRSIEEIHERWLIIGFTDTTSRTTFISLIDPESGTLLDAFEMEQQAIDEEAREKRYAEAMENREHTAADILAWAMWALNNPNPKHGTGGNFMFTCPECKNRKSHKPKFAVSPFKGYYGAHYCFDCRESGSLNTLLAKHRGLLESLKKLASIRHDNAELYATAEQLVRGRNEKGDYIAA